MNEQIIFTLGGGLITIVASVVWKICTRCGKRTPHGEYKESKFWTVHRCTCGNIEKFKTK